MHFLLTSRPRALTFAAACALAASCQPSPATSNAAAKGSSNPASAPNTTATDTAERSFKRSEVAKIIADARWIDTTRGIDEEREIDIGGIKQWIRVRGRDRRNPILLFVHGGPGSPMMPGSWVFQTPWEEYFTVVQWDQRGAGKTAAANDRAAVKPTITVDRMTQDLTEVVQYLRTSYRKEKIFLMGHSWGTIIGVNLAQLHPEWLYAYIGMGQLVYGVENEKLGYDFAMRAARAAQNTAAVSALEKIAPYPNEDGTIPVDKIIVQRQWVIAYGGLTWGRPDFAYEQNTALVSPDYTAKDVAAMNVEDLTSLEQLLGPPNKFDYRKTTTFRCPVFILGGKYDYETVTEVAQRWFQTLKAPKKEFVFFDHSSHMIPFEEPGKLLLHLIQDIRPIAGN
ncbi:MAG: alpha/beta hydrolase, partial [Gemmatimonadaceae bacterium]